MKSIYKKYIIMAALAWVACFVLFAIIYMLLIRPQSQKRLVLETQLADARRLCDAAEALTQEKVRAELDSRIEKIREKVKDYAIDEKNAADLTFAISKIANEKKVSEFSIRAADNQAAAADKNLKYVYEKRINVDFISGFNQFAGFLNELERAVPVIFIDNFKMSRSSDNPLGHKFNMGLVVLVRKRPE